MLTTRPSVRLISSLLLSTLALASCQSELASDEPSYDCSAADTLATMKKKDQPWQITEMGQSGIVSMTFSCEKSPFVGDFQECEVQLQRDGQPVFADRIFVDGGMKAHGHGLPTVPTLSATASKGQYQLEGLKYSMPGAWTVGFRVNIGGQSDQVVFDFNI